MYKYLAFWLVPFACHITVLIHIDCKINDDDDDESITAQFDFFNGTFSFSTSSCGWGHVPLAPAEGAKKSTVIFGDTKYTKKLWALLNQGWAIGHVMTNHVHRQMYNLDVIVSVSRSLKCTKIVGGWGFVPDPTEKLTALPQTTSSVWEGLLLKFPLLRGGGKGRKGRLNNICPRALETLAPPLFTTVQTD